MPSKEARSARGEQSTRGRFITVEGIEGVGKSTNLDFIANELRRDGRAVIQTREPGGTSLGEKIRELLLNPHSRISPMTELLMMFAARDAHLEEVVKPALQAGKWVVCDRFTDASRAYQGAGRGLPAATIEALATLVQRGLEPDLTLLLDAPVSVSATRQGARGKRDRFEQESLQFFTRVRDAYLEIAHRDSARVRLVDASQPLSEVQEQLRQILATVR